MTGPVYAAAASPAHFAVEHWRLANGLRVVVQTDRLWPLVACVMSYDAGSRYDPPSRQGLAHMCEHLAFSGPRRASRGTFPRRLEGIGASTQAVTTSDRLSFASICPRSELDAVLAVEAERMAAAVDADDLAGRLEIERRVLLEELQQRSQVRVHAAAVEQIHRLLFPEGHAYHRPPAGDADGIGAVTADDIRAFVACHFVPRRAVLVLAGDVAADEAATLVEQYFGQLATGPEPFTVAAPADAAPHHAAPHDLAADDATAHQALSLRVPASSGGAQAYVAWRIPGFGQPAWYAASLLLRGVTARRSGALSRHMTEAGLAHETGGRLVTMREASTLVLVATAGPGVDCARLEQGLLDAVDRLLVSRAPMALGPARRKALRDHYMTVQKLDRRADLCASLAAYLDAPGRLADEARRYEAVDEEGIAAFASTLRDTRARATLSLVPKAEAA